MHEAGRDPVAHEHDGRHPDTHDVDQREGQPVRGEKRGHTRKALDRLDGQVEQHEHRQVEQRQRDRAAGRTRHRSRAKPTARGACPPLASASFAPRLMCASAPPGGMDGRVLAEARWGCSSAGSAAAVEPGGEHPHGHHRRGCRRSADRSHHTAPHRPGEATAATAGDCWSAPPTERAAADGNPSCYPGIGKR